MRGSPHPRPFPRFGEGSEPQSTSASRGLSPEALITDLISISRRILALGPMPIA